MKGSLTAGAMAGSVPVRLVRGCRADRTYKTLACLEISLEALCGFTSNEFNIISQGSYCNRVFCTLDSSVVDIAVNRTPEQVLTVPTFAWVPNTKKPYAEFETRSGQQQASAIFFNAPVLYYIILYYNNYTILECPILYETIILYYTILIRG